MIAQRRSIAALLILAAVGSLSAQSPTVTVDGNVLRLKAPQFRFVKGEALNRLKEGRPVRADFALAVLNAPRGAVVTETRRSFNLSYDLWEERFAITRIGDVALSISHLTAQGAESWCLEHLPLTVSEIARGKPFWIRLQYEVVDRDSAPGPEDNALTLQSLIALLSRRRQAGEQRDVLEAGPFHLSD